MEAGKERDDFVFFLILFFHCGVARDRGNLKGFFLNMLKGDGREFFSFFYVEKGSEGIFFFTSS